MTPHPATILPDSRTREVRGVVFHAGAQYVPLFCVSCCKAHGGFVPKDCPASYICDACVEKHGGLVGMMPDEVFWAKLEAAQIEEYGRVLTNEEHIAALGDEGSIVAMLAKDKPNNHRE